MPTRQRAPELKQLCHAGRFEEALALAERQLDGQDSSGVDNWVAQEYLARSIDFLLEALALDDSLRGELQRSYQLVARSDDLYESRDRDAAYEARSEAARIREALFGDLHPDLIIDHLTLERIRAYELPERAVVHARRASEICAARFDQDHPLTAMALLREGEWALGRANYSLAERQFRSARDIMLSFEPAERALPVGSYAVGSDGLFEIENSLAILCRRTGRYDQAGAHFADAHAVGLEALGPDHVTLARLRGNVAVMRMYRGEFAAAEPLLRSALATLRSGYGEDHPVTLQTKTQLGQLLSELGDLDRAEEMLRDCLSRVRATLGPDTPQVAHAQVALAMHLRVAGQPHEAIGLLQSSLATFEKLDLRMDAQQTREGLAGALWRAGHLEPAHELMGELLDQFADEPMDEAQVFASMAGILSSQGRLDEALEFADRAHAMYEEIGLGDHPGQISNLRLEARLNARLGDPERAAEIYGLATRAFEIARLRAGPGLERATFRDSPYPEFAVFLAGSGEAGDAWNAAERGRARVLGELLLNSDHRPLTATEREREASLLEKMETARREVTRRSASSGSTGDAIRNLEESRAALLQHRRELAERYPGRESAHDWLQVQRSLSPGRAMIGWVDDAQEDGIAWGWVLADGKPPEFLRLNSDLPDPSDYARELASAAGSSLWIPDPGPAREMAARIGAKWITPLIARARELSGEPLRELVIVPSGRMSGIPAESLISSEGSWIGDSLSITYAPSATVHAWLADAGEPTPSGDRSALVVGDPPFRAEHLVAMRDEATRSASSGTRSSSTSPDPDSLPRLAYTRREAQGIASRVESSVVLLGEDASERRVAELARTGRLADFGFVHFATHARADLSRPERCELVLSQVGLPDPVQAAIEGHAVYDGRISVGEILETWNLDASLVTLSACETALGPRVKGEGTIGLAYALLQVGARSVLVSLWSVEDRATALLMERFYDLWLNRKEGEPALSKSEALRGARRWLRGWTDDDGNRPFDHPAIWSAFVLIGAP